MIKNTNNQIVFVSATGGDCGTFLPFQIFNVVGKTQAGPDFSAVTKSVRRVCV